MEDFVDFLIIGLQLFNSITRLLYIVIIHHYHASLSYIFVIHRCHTSLCIQFRSSSCTITFHWVTIGKTLWIMSSNTARYDPSIGKFQHTFK